MNPRGRLLLAIRRPVTMAMVFLGAVVFGLKSYQELALNLMPDLSYPSLTVRTEYPEAAPEEVESFVSRPLEEALSTVASLVEIRSVSSAGMSEVMLEFSWGTDMDFVSLDVREKMDRVVLPEEVERPTILRYNPALDPILRVGLHGGLGLSELRRIADKELKRDVEGLPGVASVKVKGGLEEEVLVEVDEARLAQAGIGMEQIGQRLAQENINLAGGSLREGAAQYLVRTLNEFVDPKEIGDVVVARKGASGAPGQQGAGAPGGADTAAGRIAGAVGLGQGEAEVRLRDVASVRWAHKKQEVITRINGQESVEVEVYKEADSNTVQVAQKVKEVLGLVPGASSGSRSASGPQGPASDFVARLARDYPGVQIRMISDPARFIRGALDEVRSTAIQGGALALLILILFLREVKSTLIIGISIPVSLVMTFVPMLVFGVSLNLMSLGGLALGVGMLVDNSIVVLESIFRCREEGDSVVDSADRGAREVGAAITASTLTTIAVFFPIVFVKGIAGQLFRDLALTVTFSLLGSLLVAFYLVPMFASRRVAIGTGAPGSGPAASKGLNELLASGLHRSGAWLAENGRPDLWLSEAWAYLSGGSPASGRSQGGDSRNGPPRADGETDARSSGPLPAAILRVYGLLHPGFEAIRFALGAAFGLVALAGSLLTVILLRVSAPVVTGARRLLSILFRPALFLFDRGYGGLSERYPKLLRWALHHRAAVAVAGALLLAHCLYLLPKLGTDLLPRIRQGQFNLRIEKAVGTPLDETSRAAGPIEQGVLEDRRVDTVFSEIGSEPGGEEALEERRGENTALLTIVLDEGAGEFSEEDSVMAGLRARLRDLAAVQIEFELPSLFSFKTPVEVEIEGNDLEELRRIAAEVEARMSRIRGLADVRSSAKAGNPEILVLFDRDRLAWFGLDVKQVAGLVQAKVLGTVSTRLAQGETRYDIRARADRSYLSTLEDLKNLKIDLQGGRSVPLSSLAEMQVGPGPSEVRRVAQRRVAVVTANLTGTDLGSVSEEVLRQVRSVELPPGYGISLGGQNREMQTSFDSLKLALGLSVFLVYIVMACQFESLLHPFVILFTIPLGLIGVVYVLYLAEIPLSVLVFIGVILLGGIVVNNAIVLVDYVNILRRRGVAKEEALIQAGRARLRPILMTAATTVLGLIPMALGIGEGAEIRAPMAITVIAGLVCSTLLTLVVIPVVYSLLDRTP
ncbi:MAG: efflux RND transporter permease subunit [bacterium]